MALVQRSHHSGVHVMSDKLWAPTVWDQLEGSVEVADSLLKPMRQIHEHGPPNLALQGDWTWRINCFRFRISGSAGSAVGMGSVVLTPVSHFGTWVAHNWGF